VHCKCYICSLTSVASTHLQLHRSECAPYSVASLRVPPQVCCNGWHSALLFQQLGPYLHLPSVTPAAAAVTTPAAMLSVRLLLPLCCFCGDASLHCSAVTSRQRANLWASNPNTAVLQLQPLPKQRLTAVKCLSGCRGVLPARHAKNRWGLLSCRLLLLIVQRRGHAAARSVQCS
jgi:hypothetical protein